MLKQGLQGFQDLHLAGHSRGRLGLPLDHGHPQRALVSGDQTLQVLKEELERQGGQKSVKITGITVVITVIVVVIVIFIKVIVMILITITSDTFGNCPFCWNSIKVFLPCLYQS